MNEIERAIEKLNAELTDLVTIKESTFLLYGEKKKNLNDLISIRKLAIQALQEKLERENPEPLGLEEIKLMENEPVYIVHLDSDFSELDGWGIVGKYSFSDVILIGKEYFKGNMCGKSWLAYRHKPDLVNVNKIEHIGEANNMLEGE